MSAGTVAKMLWGNPEQPVAAPTPAGPTPVTPITQDLFTFGLPQGFTQKDLGDGRYEMFDASGNSAGYGYKGVRDAIAEIGLNNAKSQTRNTNVDRWFAENPNATPEQIYEAASKYGVSSDLIDQARGAYKGATDEWVKSKGFTALTGTDAFRNGGGWENPYLKVAKTIWRDVNGNEVDTSQLQKIQVYGENGLEDAYYKPGEELERIHVSPTEISVNQGYDSLAGLNNDVSGLVASKQKYFGGAMGDWEALGQVLNGAAYAEQNSLGSLPTNNRDETISGTGLLYGSTPVFSKDGKLVGYRTDLTPNEAGEFGGGPDKTVNKDFGTFITHKGKSHSWNNANWRELSDPNAWNTNAVVGENGTVFIPVGNEGKLSWTNKDSYKHQDTKNSFFGAVFDALDPIIDKLDPGHNWTQDQVANLVGADSQKAAFEKVVPVVLAVVSWYFGGTVAAAASGANAVNAASKGDVLGTVLNAISGLGASGVLDSFMAGAGDAASEVAKATGMSAETHGTLSTMAKGFMNGDLKAMTNNVIDLGGTANKVVGGAVSSAVKTAVKAGASGAELEEVMKSALVGAMASLVGGTVGAGTQKVTGSGMLGTVAGTVAGNVAGSAIKDAKTDAPGAVQKPTVNKPAAQTPAPAAQSQLNGTGRVARMIWS